MVESFGIPSEAVALELLHRGVADNTAHLQAFTTAALTPVMAAVETNAARLATAPTTLRRSLAGRITKNNKALAKVGNALADNLAAQAVANTVQLTLASPSVPGAGGSSGSAPPGSFYVLPFPDGSAWVAGALQDPPWKSDPRVLIFDSAYAINQWAGQGNPPIRLTAYTGVEEPPVPVQGLPPPTTLPPPAPVPPPTTGSFGVYKDLATGKFFVTTPDVGQVPVSWGVSWDRRFDTYTAAYLYCRQRGCLDQPTGTRPPAPRPPPTATSNQLPTVPWPPDPLTPGNWWVVCVVDPLGSQKAPGAIPEADYLRSGISGGRGPFATQLAALNLIATGGDALLPSLPCVQMGLPTPPTQPPPTAPPPTTTPPGPCPVCQCCPCQCCPAPPTTPPTTPPTSPPAGPPPGSEPLPEVPGATPVTTLSCGLTATGALPAVGSPEFCACLGQFRAWLAQVGQSAVAWLFEDPITTGSGTSNFISGLIGGLLVGIETTGFASDTARRLSTDFRDRIKTVYTQIKNVLAASPLCNPAELLGLALTRTLLRTLETAHVGVNLGIHFTVHLHLRFESLETLLNYVEAHACPVEIPSPPEVVDAYLRNTITADYARCLFAMRGQDWDVFAPFIRARRDQLTTPEWIELLRRQDADTETQIAALRNVGWLDPNEAAARVELYDELPTISDHLLWLQRNVFDDEYVADFELMEGFEERFWAKFGHDLRALGMLKSTAELHYAAHWLNPAPEQLKEMVYRLRPGDVPDDVAFTVEDYARVLQEKDVSAYFRRRFEAIAFKIPALGYIRDQYRANVFDEARLKRYHQDLGYSPEDSDHFVEIDRIQKLRFRASQSHGWTPAALASAYAVGSVAAETVAERMKELGWSDDEASRLMERATAELRRNVLVRAQARTVAGVLDQVRSAQDAGILDVASATSAITGLGYPTEQATAIAQATDDTARVGLVKKATGRIRNAWHQGQIDVSQAKAALAQLGLAPGMDERLLTIWRVERTPNRKRRTALQYMDDWMNEELPEQEARARLRNLGYEEEDIRLFERAALRKKAKQEAAEAKAKAKTTGNGAAPSTGSAPP